MSELETRGTVTTAYHDKIVQEAMNRIAELEAENQRLKVALELICERPYQADTIALKALEGEG